MMLDVKLFTTILFTLDTVSILKSASEFFQTSNAFITGLENKRANLLSDLKKLYTSNGYYIITPQNKGKCFKNSIWQQCSLNDFDNIDFQFELQGQLTTFLNSASLRRTEKWLPLSVLCIKVLDAIISNIKDYFPEGSLQIFEVFNTKNLPNVIGVVPSYSNHITNVARRFLFNENEIAIQFQALLTKKITNHKDVYCSLKAKNNNAEFWRYFLTADDIDVANELKKLMNVIISLPTGSSDIERGFSVLKHIRSDRCSRMSTNLIQDTMCIWVNGPDVENFDAQRYAHYWIASGHMQSDDSQQKHSKRIKSSAPHYSIF